MLKSASVLLAGIILTYGSLVLAGAGGGHYDGHNNGTAGSGQHGTPGETAFDHMSQRGIENSNAQWATGARKGQERSGLRNQDSREHGYEGHEGQNRGKGKHQGGKGKGDKGGNVH